jgi:DHA1 family multidrug resistance protein-like MFS transporter
MKRQSPVPSAAILLAVAMFLALAAGNILTPLLPLIQDDFSITYAVAGILVSAFGFARLVLDLPTGYLQERFGARTLSAAGFAFLIGGSVLSTAAPVFGVLVAGRVLMGLGASMLSVVVLTALSALAPENARARTMALYAMANNSAIGIFPVVGGIVGSLWGWRSTMALSGVLAAVGAVLMGRILARVPENRDIREEAADADRRTSGLPVALLVALGTIYFGVAVTMINRHGFRNTILPLFAGDAIGLNPVQTATGISVMAVVGLLVAMPGGMLADRWSRRGVISAGMLVLAIGDLAFLGASSYATFLLASLVLGFGDFFAASQMAAVSEAVPAHSRGRVLAAYRFSVDIGAAIGPFFLASLLGMTGFNTTIVVGAGLLLVSSIVVQLGGLVTRGRRTPTHQPVTESR